MAFYPGVAHLPTAERTMQLLDCRDVIDIVWVSARRRPVGSNIRHLTDCGLAVGDPLVLAAMAKSPIFGEREYQ